MNSNNSIVNGNSTENGNNTMLFMGIGIFIIVIIIVVVVAMSGGSKDKKKDGDTSNTEADTETTDTQSSTQASSQPSPSTHSVGYNKENCMTSVVGGKYATSTECASKTWTWKFEKDAGCINEGDGEYKDDGSGEKDGLAQCIKDNLTGKVQTFNNKRIHMDYDNGGYGHNGDCNVSGPTGQFVDIDQCNRRTKTWKCNSSVGCTIDSTGPYIPNTPSVGEDQRTKCTKDCLGGGRSGPWKGYGSGANGATIYDSDCKKNIDNGMWASRDECENRFHIWECKGGKECVQNGHGKFKPDNFGWSGDVADACKSGCK